MQGIGTIFKYGLKLRHRISEPRTSPVEQQAKTLHALLSQAAHTQFGKHYNFQQLLQYQGRALLDQYRQRVPLCTYDEMFNQWWYKALAGEENVAWDGRIKYFALSSGTSGSPSKYIPVSNEMVKAMRNTSLRMFQCSTSWELPTSFYSGPFLFVGSCIEMQPFEQNPDILVGDVSGINTGKVPRWFEIMYKPGKRIASLRKWEDRLEEIVKHAPEWDIKFIAGIPSWVQMILEAIIKRYNVQTIHDIWANFQIYVSGGVAFNPYRKRFDQLMGKPVMYLDSYYTSEGSIACQTRPTHDGNVMPLEMMLNNGIYFEFIPFNDDNFTNGELNPNAPAYYIDEVTEGIDYALVLSTCSGAWRYIIGDTVRFVDKSRSEIIITGRTKHFLSVCGEHLSIDNMNHGIEYISQKFDVDIREFTVVAQKEQNHFVHRWYIGFQQPPTQPIEVITQALDAHLRTLNDDYATERRDNLLRSIEIHPVPLQAFYDWHAKQGRAGGQSKFPRVLNDKQYNQWLEFIQTYHF